MKKVRVFLMFSLIVVSLTACNKNESELLSLVPEVVPQQLTDSELVLKKQLSLAAQITAEILNDKNVLDEMITSIKQQPQSMTDRVKFKDLIRAQNDSRSANSHSGYFANAFKERMTKYVDKDYSSFIDELNENGIEVYIPYPIEDYPESTDIVVTSNPLDNDFVNTGYFVSDPTQTVLADEELSLTYPIVIINTPLLTNEELNAMDSTRAKMDADIAKFNEITQTNINSGVKVPPTADWYNESRHYAIYIPKIYCYNDYVEGLFASPGTMIITAGTVTFDMDSKVVLSNVEQGTTTFLLDRKYERYANNGWSSGWYNSNFFIWQDWQPAISKNSLTICIDLPTQTTTNTFSLTSTWKQSYEATIDAFVLNNELGTAATSTKAVATIRQDHLYFSTSWYRERYKYDYNTTGVVWGEDGETTVSIDNVGQRPALLGCNELLYTTYCRWW
jgi:hypothetical protein